MAISKGDAIPNVCIVEWCSSVAQPETAYIEYGRDTSYGMVAPVDLDAQNYRTVLLGMHREKTYHLRVVVEYGGDTFRSADRTFLAGPVLPIPATRFEVLQPDKTAGGFVVLARHASHGFVQNPMALIFDSEGELIWGRQASLMDSTAARMSSDGNTMAVISANNRGVLGEIEFFAMDGSSSRTLSLDGAAHDLTPTMDNGFAYLAYAPTAEDLSTECAKVMKVDDLGEIRLIFDTADVWGDNCHGTSLRYSAVRELFTVLDYEHQEIVAFDEFGSVAWVTQNDGLWEFAHGHQLLENSLLVFENGGDDPLTAVQSSVREFAFTDTSGGLELVWEYTAEKMGSHTFGDVQRLPNGNTLVAYSAEAIILEVDADGELVKILELPQLPFGYMSWRPTLYGPPESLKL